TQSAGCEDAGQLRDDVPVLLLHGDRDEILPADTSRVVCMLIGHGEVEIIGDTGHLFTEAGEHLRSRLGDWIPTQLG
ncbi:MAG: alpha/beta hydrolase, partial [Acidimicrobiia bacterium]